MPPTTGHAPPQTPSQPHVVATRGAFVEATHPFSATFARFRPDCGRAEFANGAEVVDSVGAAFSSPWRSAAKPMQLEASLRCLPPALASEIAADASLLAIAAASHSAEPGHVEAVERLFAVLGVGPDDLFCGCHRPMNEAAADALLRAGRHFDVRHNNCSGKHAMMAAAARALGADADYRPADHPLQVQIAALIERLTNTPAISAGDGCGVPTFCVDTAAMARAYAALAGAMRDAPGELRGTIGWAMARQPWLTSGSERFDLLLAERATRPIVGKIGAMGVFCVAVPDLGVGVGVKIHSGSTLALPAAVEAVLERWIPGLLAPRPADWAPTTTLDVAGRIVGGHQVQGFDATALATERGEGVR